MKRFAACLFVIVSSAMLVGCHHNRCHGGHWHEETKVKVKIRSRTDSCVPVAPSLPPQCVPVVPVAPCPPPQCVPVVPVVPCPPPITIIVQEEVCQSVPVCVPVQRWVWNPCQCRFVYVVVGTRTEFQMVRKVVSRQVVASWSSEHRCYGWTDCRGHWRPHHHR